MNCTNRKHKEHTIQVTYSTLHVTPTHSTQHHINISPLEEKSPKPIRTIIPQILSFLSIQHQDSTLNAIPCGFEILHHPSKSYQLSNSVSIPLHHLLTHNWSLWTHRPPGCIHVAVVYSGLKLVAGWSEMDERSRRSRCCWSCSHSFYPAEWQNRGRIRRRRDSETCIVGQQHVNLKLSDKETYKSVLNSFLTANIILSVVQSSWIIWTVNVRHHSKAHKLNCFKASVCKILDHLDSILKLQSVAPPSN